MKKLALLCLIAVAACTVDVPSGVIPERKLERLLYDYHLAQGMAETDSQRYELVLSVFDKYGVTEEEFDSSMVWYCGHVRRLYDIYERLNERVQRESSLLGMESEQDVFSNLTEWGDTAVIWRSASIFLTDKLGGNIVSVRIPADSTAQLGDTYSLRFSSRFVVQDGPREGYAQLVAYMDGDTLEGAAIRIGGDFDSNINISESELTRTHKLDHLQVFFYFPHDSKTDGTFRLWMVATPMLIRFHHEVEPPADAPADTLVADTTAVDTSAAQTAAPRLSPRQMRESQQGQPRTINVQKQRKVVLPQNTRRSGQMQNRR